MAGKFQKILQNLCLTVRKKSFVLHTFLTVQKNTRNCQFLDSDLVTECLLVNLEVKFHSRSAENLSFS